MELNRCIYNQMRDNPKGKVKKTNEERCRDNRDTCEDCRETPVSKIKSAHFTICQKPWVCPHGLIMRDAGCRELHQKWFDTRLSFENTFGLASQDNSTKGLLKDVFHGYCKGQGGRSYIPMKI